MINEAGEIFSAIIIRPPEEKDKSFKLIIQIRKMKEDNHWKTVNQKCLVYCEKNRLPFVPEYGDLILFHAGIKRVDPPMNPDQFDYRKYLQNQGVTIQCYIRSADIVLLKKNRGNPIISFSLRIRNFLKQILVKNGIKGEEFAVLSAILLGDSRNLDAELRQAYAATGATHILCVSGLHVGVIYLIISRLLQFLERRKRDRIVRTVILFGVIWLYAFITGCSPSVLRATAMFTFILFGKLMERHTSVFNSIAASAIFLLCIDPLMILNLGFQLSYMAVLGIVLFQPGLSSVIMISGKFFRAIWDLVTVSVAAQIGTFPLVLYYFHQFPTYFLVTNLVVIPLSSLIIYLGILLFAVSWIPWVIFAVSYGLNFLVKIMNGTIRLIDHIPGSVVKDISISTTDMILFLVLTASLFVFFQQRNRIVFLLSLLSILLILVSRTFQKYLFQTQSKVVVYHVPKTSIQATLLSDECLISGTWTDDKLSQMNTQSHHISSWIRHKQYHLPHGRKPICIIRQFRNLRYMEVKAGFHLEPLNIKSPLSVDFILISGPIRRLDDCLVLFDTRQVVLAPSLNRREAARIAVDAEKRGIKCHNVSTEGAFVKEDILPRLH